MSLNYLIKCRKLLDSGFVNLNNIKLANKLLHNRSTTTSANYGVWSSGHLKDPSVGQFQQQVRFGHKYHVREGSIKWLRRRAKALDQRLQVLNPSSPVIEQRTPLPLTNEGRYNPNIFGIQEERDLVKEEQESKGIVLAINQQMQGKDHGRLFAVVHVKGKQFKVTPEDILIIQGYWAPDIGDRLRLHKVLLMGGTDFTIVGRPIIDPSLVRVEGTVIEKTMSYLKVHFKLQKRKNYRRFHFHKDPYTMLRINMVEMLRPLDILQETELKQPKTLDGNFTISTKEAVN